MSAHVYRRAIRDAVGWLASVTRGNFPRAFTYEESLWFFFGYLSVRYKEFREHGHGTHVGELCRFGWVLTRRLFRRPTVGRAPTKAENGYTPKASA